MNKELKAFDKELKNNQFVRIADITNKAQNSLFRALAMAVFFSHAYTPQVKQELRLTLIGNLNDRKNNPYPPLSQGNLLKKYLAQPQLVMDYCQQQHLDCFVYDNLMLASAAFGMQVCVLSLDKEEYLNQLYIMGSKNPRERRINLGKIGKKFYCVFEQPLNATIKFFKQNFLNELLNTVFEEEDYLLKDLPAKDKLKPHKKSLSECNELSQQEIFPEEKKERSNQKEVPRRSPSPINSPVKTRQGRLSIKEEVIVPSKAEQSPAKNYDISPDRGSQMSPSKFPEHYVHPQYDPMADSTYSNYYYPQSQYSPYMMTQDQHYMSPDNPYGYVDSNPVNNERYTGRLKFFDQSGNYGFIVIDNLNIDLFVHYDDLSKAGLSKEKLLLIKNNYEMRFEFTYYEYEGKQHRKSKKAVDLQLIE